MRGNPPEHDVKLSPVFKKAEKLQNDTRDMKYF